MGAADQNWRVFLALTAGLRGPHGAAENTEDGGAC